MKNSHKLLVLTFVCVGIMLLFREKEIVVSNLIIAWSIFFTGSLILQHFEDEK